MFLSKIYRFAYILFIAFILLASCSDNKEKEAQTYLNEVKQMYAEGNYEAAKERLQKIDTFFPKAIKQRKEGYALLQEVRKGINDKQIVVSDSLSAIYTLQIEDLKKSFRFSKNAEYQSKGVYIPKNDPHSSNTLRSGVIENGNMYIESVYTGSQKHSRLKVSTDGKTFAMTNDEYGDGLNYRLGGTEIIRFTRISANDVFDFIYNNRDKPIKVSLEGTNNITYNLSKESLASICLSYQLADAMLKLEKAQEAKLTAILLNEHLQEEKAKSGL